LAGPAAAAPVASFTYAPTLPFTGQTVTFTSTSSGATTIDWDLDGDGLCNDASGPTAARSFAAAGAYDVKICLDGTAATQTQTVTVANRPPAASFGLSPAHPVAREAVVLTSTSVDPDGPIAAQQWDLDGDGAFDDSLGEIAHYTWPKAGTYPIALRVVDRDGAAAVARANVVVDPRPAKQFHTTPLVRFISQPTTTGARLALLTVAAPRGAHIGVRCRGGGCPYRHKRTTSKGKTIALRRLARRFRAGAVIEIRVTKSETIGKYTRLRFRAGRTPRRIDRCLKPGKPNKPYRCA
jgi:hypothetical protein